MNWFKKIEHNCFENKVKCATCKCWLDKEEAYFITEHWPMGGRSKTYYCGAHKPSLDEVWVTEFGTTYYKNIPSTQIEVDKNGKPIRNKKK